MLVVSNGKTVRVGWKYRNPYLEERMKKHGLDPKLLKGMSRVQIYVTLGLLPKEVPDPPVTECFIVDTGKEELVKVSVTRHHKDVHDKDKARKYSLSKALHQLYPGPENRENRKAFWDVYLTRKQPALESKNIGSNPDPLEKVFRETVEEGKPEEIYP